MDDPRQEDPRQLDITGRLNAMGLTPIVGQSFTDQTIYLDGRSFERCTFTRCHFRSRLGWFRFVGKTPMSDCDLVLDNPSAQAFDLADGLRASLIGRGVNPSVGRPGRPD